jgi:hypothetical protein
MLKRWLLKRSIANWFALVAQLPANGPTLPSTFVEKPLSLTLSDALEATRIGLAITRSLHSAMPETV